MHHGKDNNAIGLRDIEDPVRETANQMPAHVPVNHGIGFRTPLDPPKSFLEAEKVFGTQTSPLLFVPGICFLNVSFGLWANQQLSDHLEPLSLSLISSQVLPSAGNLL